MSFLLERGQSRSAIARLLGVTEGTVRYHERRRLEGRVDGRGLQAGKADAYGAAILHWRDQQGDGRINLADLHGWLMREQGYEGSLKSVQRYWGRHFPGPVLRARRRVETPPGAQAQVDWAEFPGVWLGSERVDLSAFVMTLSWSRRRVVIWSRSKDMLAWQDRHLAAFTRLGGVPAVLRLDNVKTAISQGAGSWGRIHESYRRFAGDLKFHVDACQPRHPQGKGKVERSVRDLRETLDPRRLGASSLEELQALTDARLASRAATLRCPATGGSVLAAWEQERRVLTPLPDPPPVPFDLVVRRVVGLDCMISFEGRRYSVPFRFVKQEVEVRGLADRVVVLKNCERLAEHARGTEALILCDEAHFAGPDTDRVRAPMPLGRMGRKLEEIARSPVQHRSLELYARLAEVAR